MHCLFNFFNHIRRAIILNRDMYKIFEIEAIDTRTVKKTAIYRMSFVMLFRSFSFLFLLPSFLLYYLIVVFFSVMPFSTN